MYQQCSIRLFLQIESLDNSSDKVSDKNINIINTIKICKTAKSHDKLPQN